MKKGNDAILKDVLQEFLESPAIRPRYNQLRVRDAWNELVGNTAVQYTNSLKLKEGELIIEITSAPLRQEFLFRKTELIRLLNENLGENLVKSIDIL
jgi:hypothetical protein